MQCSFNLNLVLMWWNDFNHYYIIVSEGQGCIVSNLEPALIQLDLLMSIENGHMFR